MGAAYGLEEFVLLKLHTKSIFSCSNVNTMSKRKGISESDKAPKKKLKGDSIDAPKTFVSKLSFDSSEQCLRSLIYPTTLEDFLTKYWEKEPLFVHRNDSEFFKEFPTKAKLEENAEKEQLTWDQDVYLSQPENETKIPQAEGPATVKDMQKYLKEKLSISVHAPYHLNVSFVCFLAF